MFYTSFRAIGETWVRNEVNFFSTKTELLLISISGISQDLLWFWFDPLYRDPSEKEAFIPVWIEPTVDTIVAETGNVAARGGGASDVI